jgi:TolB-like protein
LPGPDIFLSYNREDAAVAKLYADTFAREGFDVWWDQTLRSGETYDEVTEAALRGAKAVVVLWSPRSVASHWVRAEATIAHRTKTLIPATIEPCDKPVMFELTQTADLSNWQGEAGDPAWRAFLNDVRRMVEPNCASERLPAETVAPPAQTSPSRPMTVAVLPFVNRSSIPEDEPIAETMAEDITAALSVGGRYLTVVAASATAAYRGGPKDLRQIGRALNVLFLLEGNIRRLHSDLRLTLQLVEAETGKIVWTQKFDRPMAELFVLLDDLVTEVTDLLRAQLERAEMDHALKKLDGITSEESVLRAFQYASAGTHSGWEAAVADCRRALEIDPGNGFAHGHLAAHHAFLLHHRGGASADEAKEILGNIERARTYSANDRSVLESIATALTWLRKPEEALPYAVRAVAMSGDIASAHQVLGMVLAMLGRSDEAIAEFDNLERHFSGSLYANFTLRWRSVAHLKAGRYEQARDAAELALRTMPGVDTLIQSIICSQSLGDEAGARANMHRLRELDPNMTSDHAASLIRDVYNCSASAEEYVERIRELWDDTGFGS